MVWPNTKKIKIYVVYQPAKLKTRSNHKMFEFVGFTVCGLMTLLTVLLFISFCIKSINMVSLDCCYDSVIDIFRTHMWFYHFLCQTSQMWPITRTITMRIIIDSLRCVHATFDRFAICAIFAYNNNTYRALLILFASGIVRILVLFVFIHYSFLVFANNNRKIPSISHIVCFWGQMIFFFRLLFAEQY